MHEELAPDLVLVDMNLYDMNGLDVIRVLGKTACPPRIVAMSGWGLPVFDMAILLGADKLLEKPFAIQELLDIVPLKAA